MAISTIERKKLDPRVERLLKLILEARRAQNRARSSPRASSSVH